LKYLLTWVSRLKSTTRGGAPSAHAALSDHKELIKAIGVLAQHALQPCSLDWDRLFPQSEQDDTGVGKSFPDDEFAEVLIVGDEDTLLSVGER
jgi:hypothetical protein